MIPHATALPLSIGSLVIAMISASFTALPVSDFALGHASFPGSSSAVVAAVDVTTPQAPDAQQEDLSTLTTPDPAAFHDNECANSLATSAASGDGRRVSNHDRDTRTGSPARNARSSAFVA